MVCHFKFCKVLTSKLHKQTILLNVLCNHNLCEVDENMALSGITLSMAGLSKKIVKTRFVTLALIVEIDGYT